MKRSHIAVLVSVLLVAVVAFSLAQSRGKLDLKVGDELSVCNCGEKCACTTMSRSPGQCTCGKDMVKAKVTKIEKGKASMKAEGWEKERPFKMAGKVACACPPDCKCDTISQNPGKCTCGKDMK